MVRQRRYTRVKVRGKNWLVSVVVLWGETCDEFTRMSEPIFKYEKSIISIQDLVDIFHYGDSQKNDDSKDDLSISEHL